MTKQSITLTLTAQEAVSLIGLTQLPKSLTQKVVTAIQQATATDPAATVKRTRTRKTAFKTPFTPATPPEFQSAPPPESLF